LKERLDRGTKNGKVYVPWKINYYSILVVGGSEGKESSSRTRGKYWETILIFQF
jgi:hypothetical protein